MGIIEDGFNLVAGDTGEPFEEVVQPCAVFEVLEQGSDGNARAGEKPGTADFAGRAFDDGTLTPIKHDLIVRFQSGGFKRIAWASQEAWLLTFVSKSI